MGKSKLTKKLKEKGEEPEMRVKLIAHSNPKFAHNALAANKDVVWTYEFWKTTDPGNKGQLEIEMDLNKMKKMNENKQSEKMNDDAIAAVEANYPDFKGKVKLTSR